MTDKLISLPGISFSRKRASVLIYQSTVHALGQPKYVRLLCNEKRKRLAVQICAAKETGAIKVPMERGNAKPFLLSSLIMQRLIWNICGWERDGSYLVHGTYLPRHELVEFDLTKAERIADNLFADPECLA